LLNFLTWLTLLVKFLVKKVVILLHSFLIILFNDQKWKEHKSKEHWFKYGLCPKKYFSLCRQIRAVFPIGILPKIIIVEQGTIALTIQTDVGFRHFNISCGNLLTSLVHFSASHCINFDFQLPAVKFELSFCIT